jgi:hypothetical protein
MNSTFVTDVRTPLTTCGPREKITVLKRVSRKGTTGVAGSSSLGLRDPFLLVLTNKKRRSARWAFPVSLS